MFAITRKPAPPVAGDHSPKPRQPPATIGSFSSHGRSFGGVSSEAEAREGEVPRPVPLLQRSLASIPLFYSPTRPSASNAARGTASLPSLTHPVQAKLEVGAEDDPLEREAEAAAEKVMGGRGGDDDTRGLNPATHAVQRLSNAGAAAGVEAPPSAVSAINRLRQSGGRPLAPELRAFYEQRMGEDFGAVRVHTGPAASGVAEELGAKALTVGKDVVFGEGHYRPGTSEGKRLIAHELSHVVQQTAVAGVTQRSVVQRDPAEEKESIPPGSKRVVKTKSGGALLLRVRPDPSQTLADGTPNSVGNITSGTTVEIIAKNQFGWYTVKAVVGIDGGVRRESTGFVNIQYLFVANAVSTAQEPVDGQVGPSAVTPAASKPEAGDDNVVLGHAIAQAIVERRFAFIFTELDMRGMRPMLAALDWLSADEIGVLIDHLKAPHTDGRFVERLRAALTAVALVKGTSAETSIDPATVLNGMEAIAKEEAAEDQVIDIADYVKGHASSAGAQSLLQLLYPAEESEQSAGVLHAPADNGQVGILSSFKAAVRAKALAVLDGNRTAIDEEEVKYADTRQESPVWEELRSVIKPMLWRDRKLQIAAKEYEAQAAKAEAAAREIDAVAKSRAKSEAGEAGAEGARSDTPIDHAQAAIDEQKEFTASRDDAKVGAPVEREGDESVSGALEDLHAYAALWKQKAESARGASLALHKAYPILAAGDIFHDEGTEGASGASAKGSDTNEELFEKVREQTFVVARQAIDRTRERLLKDDTPLAHLDLLVRSVEDEMHLDEPDHASDKKVIDDWVADMQAAQAEIQLAFAGATIALGIAALITGGAAAVILGLMGSGIGVYAATENLEYAAMMKDVAVAGEIGDPLAKDAEDAKAAYYWAIIDLVLAGVDFAIAVKEAAALVKTGRLSTVARQAAERKVFVEKLLKKVTNEPISSTNAKSILSQIRKAEAEGTIPISYELRKELFDRSGGAIETIDAFTYKQGASLGPDSWLPERRALHDQLVSSELEKAQYLSDRLREPGTVYALRGNTASGKTTTVRAHPDLGPRALDINDNLTGTINPDTIKGRLVELEGSHVTNDQVHREGSMLAKRVEAEMLKRRGSSLIVDKRFAGSEDIPKLLETIGDRKLKIIDLDVPMETSAVRVLMREPGSADPLVRFRTVEEGFAGIRRNRRALIDGSKDGFAGVRFDPRITDYELHVTDAEGKSVLVASKREGLWHDPDTPEKVALFKQAADPMVEETIQNVKSTVIDDAFIEKTVSPIKDGDYKNRLRKRLEEYKGKTLEKALDTHSQLTQASNAPAAPKQ